MFALEPAEAGAALQALAAELNRPRAVLVISPHWETRCPTVGTTEAVAGNRLETIHDFGGFDPRLYEIQYPATGSPQADQEVVKALQAAGLQVTTDPRRGLDHSAWVPLRYLFPSADVPVVPLSIQHHCGPVHAYRVGQALAPLAEQGWLIMASGSMAIDTSYARRFTGWLAQQLEAGNAEALLDYRQKNPDTMQAQPHGAPLPPRRRDWGQGPRFCWGFAWLGAFRSRTVSHRLLGSPEGLRPGPPTLRGGSRIGPGPLTRVLDPAPPLGRVLRCAFYGLLARPLPRPPSRPCPSPPLA